MERCLVAAGTETPDTGPPITGFEDVDKAPSRFLRFDGLDTRGDLLGSFQGPRGAR